MKEIDPYLDEKDDIKITDSRWKRWSYVAEDDEERSKVHTLGWDI